MKIRQFEELITSNLNQVIGYIIKQQPQLTIAVKKGERVGDGISKYLENKFVETTLKHKYFKESIASPEGKTKNPFDVQTIFEINKHRELIWIDFKAVNIDNIDTNPDSGTPDKIITLIQNGFFYLAYIFVYYKGNDKGLTFVKHRNTFVKAYFLKDVSHTMRITPANQMQVNGFVEPTYRTREQFLDFLLKKKIESNERKLKKATNALKSLRLGKLREKTNVYDEISIATLKKMNKRQEDMIKKL